MNNVLNQIVSIRQMQAYGAICLATFCKHYGVFNKDLIQLINHLFSILIVEDLTDWEEKGTYLTIKSFGEPIPEEAKESFPNTAKEYVQDIVEDISLIGVIDMYGALTDRPLSCLRDALSILEKLNITPPPVKPLAYHDDSGWGNRIREDRFLGILNEYKNVHEFLILN